MFGSDTIPKEVTFVAYRFSGRFSGRIFRMDARQRVNRKERRLQSTERRLAVENRRLKAIIAAQNEELQGGSDALPSPGQKALPPPSM